MAKNMSLCLEMSTSSKLRRLFLSLRSYYFLGIWSRSSSCDSYFLHIFFSFYCNNLTPKWIIKMIHSTEMDRSTGPFIVLTVIKNTMHFILVSIFSDYYFTLFLSLNVTLFLYNSFIELNLKLKLDY